MLRDSRPTGYEELAFGAIATGGMCVLNKPVLENLARVAQPVPIPVSEQQRVEPAARTPSSLRSNSHAGSENGPATSTAFIGA
jgi:hypothetical protein